MGSPYTDYRDAPGVGLGCLEFDRVLAFTFVTKSAASNLRCQCRLASNPSIAVASCRVAMRIKGSNRSGPDRRFHGRLTLPVENPITANDGGASTSVRRAIECRLALGRRELSGRTAAILETCGNQKSDIPGLVFLRDINGMSVYRHVQPTWRAYIALSREYYTLKNIVYSVRRETLSRVFCFDPRPMRRNWLNPQEEVA